MIQAIYDPVTGAIYRAANSATPQARAGEAMFEIERGTIFSDTTHFIDLSGPAPVLALKPQD